MKLIHFAHLGEAQTFIKQLRLTRSDTASGLYTSDSVHLLVSGEGPFESLGKISFLLGTYKYTKVINYGIAGALNKNLDKDEIYPIRTVYSFSETAPRFKSFTSELNNISSKLDCITTESRVLDDSMASELSCFADIVDRELWGVSYACHMAKVGFESFKLISDYAGNETQCFDIKAQALKFSDTLYEHYLSFSEQQDLDKENIDEFTCPFHLSFNHKHQFIKVIKALKLKYGLEVDQVYSKIHIQEIQGLGIKEKMKVTMMMNRLQQLLNPLEKKIDEQIEQAIKPFTQIGGKVKYDPYLESKKLTLQMEINSQSNLTSLKRAIDLFDFKRIERIWRGDIDV